MAGGTGVSERLIEREAELALLANAVARLDRADGTMILISGPAGIGKTRLMIAAAEMASAAGATVLRGRGAEVERDVPFGIVRQLLERQLVGADPVLREEWTAGAARRSLPIVAGEGAGDGRLEHDEAALGLLHGVYWLVANMSVTRPLALLIDDAHWADAPSLRALAYLGRRLEGVAVVVILAARAGGELAELARDPEVRQIELEPLTPEGTASLVRELTHDGVDPGALTLCHETSGGNPLLVRELVFALEQGGREVTEQAVAELAQVGADSLTHEVMLRLGVLGADAVAVATAVSVLDLDSQLSHVAALAGLGLAATTIAAERLAGARILADATPLSFAHPLLRAAVYRDLTAVQRTVLHGRAAAMLRDARAPVERVATHLLATEPARDAGTAEFLIRAGEGALAKAAPLSAVRYLRRALDEPPADAQRGQVLLKLGTAQFEAGEPQRAEAHLRESLTLLGDPAQRAQAALTLANVLVGVAGHASAIRALTEASSGLEGDLALRLDVERTILGVFVPELAADAGRRMRAYARLVGKTTSERLALVNAGIATAFDATASAADAARLARRALAGDPLEPTMSGMSRYAGTARYTLFLAEDLDTAERDALRALETAGVDGSPMDFASVTSTLAQVALSRGMLAEAIAHGEAIIAASRDMRRTPTTTRFYFAAPALYVAVPLVAMGELGRARQVLDTMTMLGDLDTAELNIIRYGRGVVELAEGEYEAALADFIGYGAVCAQVGYEERFIAWRQGAARAEHALGRPGAAIARAEEELKIAGAWGAPGGLGAALRVRAVVGDPRESVDRLGDAVKVLRTSAWRLELAGCLVDYGIALRTSGLRRQARDILEEGMDLAARCGAWPLTERARQELQVLGARPRRLMFSGIESLTASELRVATMAANGMSNPEIAQALFVTRKTVENHLANTYRKLEITSRGQLPNQLAQVAERVTPIAPPSRSFASPVL